MNYNFDEIIERRHTASEKWDTLASRFGTTDVIPMWVADMDFKSPPSVIQALQQRVKHGVYGYTVRPESYFQAIVDWMQRRHHWTIESEWIANSPGVVPALAMMVNTFTQPGDKVIIQPPVYHHFSKVINDQGRQVVENPLKLEDGRYTMDFDDLVNKIDEDVKMLILCNPHNPVGRVWSEQELRTLGKICVEHNILVVADEIHCDIVYKQYKHVPFASISSELADRTLTCIAPSKTFNLLGLQTSSIIIPNPELRHRLQTAIDAFALCSANTFGTVALETAYNTGEPWLDELLDYIQGNLNFARAYLAEHMPLVRFSEPEGTYLVWLDCRGLGLSTDALDDFMLAKARIACNEGHIFGHQGEGFMRMNIACPRSILEQSLQQFAAAVQSLCGV